MNTFAPILEKALAVKEFDYAKKPKRILNFGSAVHPNTKNRLTWGLDLDTLTPDDLAILLNPEYLSYAWGVSDPIQRKDRLINIINRNEKVNRKGGAEEGFGSAGERLMYHRGPPEHHDTRRTTTANGETIDNLEPHSSGTASFKSFSSEDIEGDGTITLDLEPFQRILEKLHDADEDYTFKNLSDNYLKDASETGEARDIEPEDIKYDEQEEFAVPEVVDDTPVEISDIDEVPDAEEIEPEEVDVEFEPEEIEAEVEPKPEKPEVKPEIPKPEVKPEIKPEIPEPTPEPEIPEIEEPSAIDLEPDIETAIDTALGEKPKQIKPEKTERSADMEGDMETKLDQLGAKQEIEDMPGTAKSKEGIEESIIKSLSLAGLL